jgi:O-glycosyl hydrolase
MMLVTPFLLTLPLLAAAVDVQVVFNRPRQRIDGFGASAAFTADEFKTLPSATSSTILDKLFSTTSGAGLSIVRVRLSPFTYVSGTGAFDGSVRS